MANAEVKTEEATTEIAAPKGTGINWANGRTVVRDVYGSIDVMATVERIENELMAFVAETEIDTEVLSKAVTGALHNLTGGNENVCASIDLNGLSLKALALIPNVPDKQATKLQEKLKAFCRGESLRFEESLGAEGALHIRRGRASVGGGGANAATKRYRDEYVKSMAKKAAAAASK